MAMKNKKFMTLVLAGMVSIQVVGCGASAGSDTERNSEIVTETENVSEMETEKGTETQASSETESETQVATNDNTEKESEKEDETKPAHSCDFSALKNDANNHWYACSCGKTANSSAHGYADEYDADCNVCGYKRNVPEKPVHTCNFATLKTDANNHWYACSCGNTSGKGGHGYDDEYDASCNTCGYTRSVPERPAPPSDEKESIKFTGGTITLPTTGVTIPTLPHFNTAGMQPGGDAWWTGQEGDGNAQAGMNSIYNTCEQFTQKMRELDKGSDVSKFNASRNLIEWSWLGAGMAGDFELYRGTEYYTLTVNCSLKDFKNGAGEQLAQYNRDIVTVLISFISSEVETVAGAIIEDMIGTEQFDGSWKTVGDCKVMFDYNSSSNGHYVYKIKAK